MCERSRNRNSRRVGGVGVMDDLTGGAQHLTSSQIIVTSMKSSETGWLTSPMPMLLHAEFTFGLLARSVLRGIPAPEAIVPHWSPETTTWMLLQSWPVMPKQRGCIHVSVILVIDRLEPKSSDLAFSQVVAGRINLWIDKGELVSEVEAMLAVEVRSVIWIIYVDTSSFAEMLLQTSPSCTV